MEQAVASWRQRPFQRGLTDCCAFCNHVMRARTGKDLLPEYGDDAGAQAIIERHGTLAAAVTHYLGLPWVQRDQVRPGDVVLLDIFDHQTIGILLPNHRVAVVVEYQGLREVRDDFMAGGWHTWV